MSVSGHLEFIVDGDHGVCRICGVVSTSKTFYTLTDLKKDEPVSLHDLKSIAFTLCPACLEKLTLACFKYYLNIGEKELNNYPDDIQNLWNLLKPSIQKYIDRRSCELDFVEYPSEGVVI